MIDEEKINPAGEQTTEKLSAQEPLIQPLGESRMARRIDRKTRKTVILTLLGIIVIGILVVLFGIPLLVNMSLLLEKNGDSNKSTAGKNENMLLVAPILNPTFSATNSATITIDGTATENQKIKLFVNNESFGQVSVKSNGEFIFEKVPLSEGENIMKAQLITKDNKKSTYSNILRVSYIKNPPELEISYPSNDQSFSSSDNPIQVTGKASPEAKVTVNGFWAIIDEEGNYKYDATLKEGDNTLTVVATDQAGNTTEKEVKVKYSP